MSIDQSYTNYLNKKQKNLEIAEHYFGHMPVTF